MKLLISLFLIAIIGYAVYYFLSKKTTSKQKHKKADKKALGITAAVVVVLLGGLTFLMYRAETAPDIQCGKMHTTPSYPPANLKTAMDYFEQGNYEYDRGNCQKAIVDYTRSIELNPKYPQAYNNRGYTYMRMRDYQAALPDFDKAIALNPKYIQALMNRGDIHNYYYQIDRPSAVADYEKVISLGGGQETSVCGHLFLAKHEGWKLGTLLDLPSELFSKCR